MRPATNSVSWRELEVEYRALVSSVRLVATSLNGRWTYTFDGPSDPREGDRLRLQFDSVANLSGLAAGAPNAQEARDFWLNIVRHECPYHFNRMSSSSPDGSEAVIGGYFNDVVAASAECCHGLEIKGQAESLTKPPINPTSESMACREKIGSKEVIAQISRPQSFEEVRAKFLAVADRFPNVAAHWHSQDDRWTFEESPEGEFAKPADLHAEEIFKELCRPAVRLLNKSSAGRPAFHLWLDLMRDGKRGFQHIRKARSWSEFLTAVESNGCTEVGDKLDDGAISQVFKESAAFCADLDSEPAAGGEGGEVEIQEKQVMRTYPKHFSRAARARVEAAILRAGMEFDQRKLNSLSAGSSQFESLFDRYVLDAFLIFAKECCLLVETGAMDVVEVDELSLNFLDSFSWTARAEKGVDRSGNMMSPIHSGIFNRQTPHVLARFRKSAEWADFESMKLRAAQSVADEESDKRDPQIAPADPASGEDHKWHAVTITFLSDDRVQILQDDQRSTFNYHELGFDDGRNGKPNQAWIMLRLLAEQQGTVREAKTSDGWPMVEKRIQEIRKVLRTRFSTAIDPIPFVEGVGYKTSFKIELGPSFGS